MKNVFEIEHLNYAVNNKKILKDINLKVTEGEYLTITGPSGSGKSTLLKNIATLLTPTSGEILYFGKRQSKIKKETYRREVSYCFQQPSLFGDTVKDNLSFPFLIRNMPFDETKAKDALKSVDLPIEMLNKPITELSGGEKQRVALIRNVLFLPKVLLLDEVTTGLDKETKDIVHEMIERLNIQKNITILTITHDESEISVAHKIIKIVAGRLEE